MIGMVVNHLLVKMDWSDHLQKNSNDLYLSPDVIYFQTKRNDELGYMEVNLLLNILNKGSSTRPIDKIMSLSTIHDPFLNNYFTK